MPRLTLLRCARRDCGSFVTGHFLCLLDGHFRMMANVQNAHLKALYNGIEKTEIVCEYLVLWLAANPSYHSRRGGVFSRTM